MQKEKALETPQSFIEEEERIEQFARLCEPSIAAAGIGGAGCNVISWVKERGVTGGKLVSINTDAPHLRMSKADRRILIGEKLTKGLGCGGYPELGEKALCESADRVVEELCAANIIFLIAGLGGGTGTGATVALAEKLRKQFLSLPAPHLIVGVVTLPFDVETARMDIAKNGLNRLKGICDTVVVIDNNRLVKIAGNLPFREALGVANTTIGKFVKGITETITTASLINLDYADLRAIMEGSGLASIGIGEGKGEGRVEQAVERALNGRLLDIEDVTKARGLLIHVSGGEDLTLYEVNHAAEIVKRSLPPKAKVVWGARVDEELQGSASVMAVITGVESAFLRRHEKRIGRLKLPW
ncbi:MAG: cell division protein FtsZ [Candidatus Bathyarchaeota archaeon]|nr:cell division protein FtsZ [Candidatus Bathyarchaeota archaeon]MDH5746830.1 cell division protein FtsZ [Candidatus Bathyarchaeota archaeon]